jgi:hypothetical protein
MGSLRFRLTYDGLGPAIWTPAPGAFGLQDKDGVLHVGTPDASGHPVFEFALQARPHKSGGVILTGPFAHGTPEGRFLYLGWRRADGAFAQRLKVPLGAIPWDAADEAMRQERPLVATLVDQAPRATKTGANIGGTRAVEWRLG